MLIEQQSRATEQTLNESLLKRVDKACSLYYEFVLKVQSRERSIVFSKTLERPPLPLHCQNITIGNGFYKIARTTLDVDERIVYVYLEPQIITNADVFTQCIKELLETGWHE